jgi:hypothetical protein
LKKKPSNKSEKTLLRMSWWAMINRCYDHENDAFARYGGRGITVCERWLKSFDAFAADMGSRPSRFHSIERADNDGPYSPQNCYWATPTQQTRNKRSNLWVTYGGETLILKDMAAKHSKSYGLLYDRVVTHGWDIASAIERPVQRGGDRRGYHPASSN